MENPTNDAQTGAESTPAAVGEKAVTTSSLTLDEINQLTGKQYKDKDAALKSIADMAKMAGKAADLEGRAKEATELANRVQSLELETFFARNPEHEANRKLLESLAKGNGVSVQEAVSLPEYQDVLERVKKAGSSSPSRRTIADGTARVIPANDDAEARKKVYGDKDASAAYIVERFFK